MTPAQAAAFDKFVESLKPGLEKELEQYRSGEKFDTDSKGRRI